MLFFHKPTRIIAVFWEKHLCRNCLHKRIPRMFPALLKAIGLMDMAPKTYPKQLFLLTTFHSACEFWHQ